MLPSTLETARLLLRAPVPADAALLFRAYAQDARVARFMMWRPHESVAATDAFIAQGIVDFAAGTRLPYVLAKLDRPDQPIGMLEARPAGHKVDFGYVLERACWGQGLMPEAVAALAQATLAVPGFFRVQAFCDVENLASQRTLEKSGFVREGRHERFIVHPNLDDEPRPCFMYARCR